MKNVVFKEIPELYAIMEYTDQLTIKAVFVKGS